jgi:hypothetical protein
MMPDLYIEILIFEKYLNLDFWWAILGSFGQNLMH